MNDLQAMVTGAIALGLAQQGFLKLDVEMESDEHGNYLPWFYVTGSESGIRLRVSVEEAER